MIAWCPKCLDDAILIERGDDLICTWCGDRKPAATPRPKAITTVRPNELRCSNCGKWKPDADYSHESARPSRRYHAQTCRPCDKIRRRLATIRRAEKRAA